MDFKQLNQQMKKKELRPVYILTGSEDYLKDFYRKRLTELLVDEHLMLLNSAEFEGAKFSASDFQEAADSYPFMAEKKLIVLKNTGVFTRAYKNAEVKELLLSYFKKMPEYLHLIFIEDKVDKSSDLLKKAAKTLEVVELEFLKAQDLIAWISKQAALRGKKISNDTIAYLVEKCDSSLYAIIRELDKLAGYLGDQDTIKKEQIDLIVTKSLESRIFDLVDSLVAGNKEEALRILNDLKQLREPEVKIASIVSQHFISLLFTKLQLSQQVPISEIARKMKKRDFVIRKYSQQVRGMDMKTIRRVIENCSEMDLCLKTSRYEDGFFALEQFVFAY